MTPANISIIIVLPLASVNVTPGNVELVSFTIALHVSAAVSAETPTDFQYGATDSCTVLD